MSSSAEAQAKRLKLAREHAGYVSARQAALRHGWKYPTYCAHESAQRNLTPLVASRYARAFHVYAEFLLFGSRFPAWDHVREQLQEVQTPARTMRMFSTEPAADIERFVEKPISAGRQYVIADTEDLPPFVYAVQVSLPEMVPAGTQEAGIPPDDIVIVNAKPDRIDPGHIVVVTQPGEDRFFIRKVKSLGRGSVEYVALNGDYAPIYGDDVGVMGRVILHIRRV